MLQGQMQAIGGGAEKKKNITPITAAETQTT